MCYVCRVIDFIVVVLIRKEEGKVESKKKIYKYFKGFRKSYKMSIFCGFKL